jgi:hypothetical protein
MGMMKSAPKVLDAVGKPTRTQTVATSAVPVIARPGEGAPPDSFQISTTERLTLNIVALGGAYETAKCSRVSAGLKGQINVRQKS